MRSLTVNEKAIIEYLKDKDFTSPTEIGGMVGPPGSHSAWGSPICLRLVSIGLLERNGRGHYRLAKEETPKERENL